MYLLVWITWKLNNTGQKNYVKILCWFFFLYGNLAKIKLFQIPCSIYIGDGDGFTSVKDAYNLAEDLPNVIQMRVVNHTGFGHFEYWYAKDADKLVHDEIVSMMKDAAYRIANPITKIRDLGYFYHAFLIPFVLPISFI